MNKEKEPLTKAIVAVGSLLLLIIAVFSVQWMSGASNVGVQPVVSVPQNEKKRLSERIRIKMVTIPAGEFTMGSDKGDKYERPRHKVFLSSFSMQESELTWAQYQPCIDAEVCPSNKGGGDHGWGKGSRPVIDASWNDITQYYIPWLNKQTGEKYRLPTESEWEYAARAGSTTKYSWGDEIGHNNANCRGCGSQWDGKKTAQVKSFKPNAFGLYDMHGNVDEWVQDCWNDSYIGAPKKGEAWEKGSCNRRVLRGGSLSLTPAAVRSATRDWSTTSIRYLTLGFRLVQDR